MKTRVVLAIGSAKQRTLTRLGLEMSGHFDVVGAATDQRDVEFVVGTLRPDVVLVDFDTDDASLEVVPAIGRAWPDAVPVIYRALLARAGATRLAPIQIARVLGEVIDHPAVAVA